jgi:ATP adenylyltransferase/5',5'''-P-1,P-4-tetraphosphate phosphorylase II
MNYQEKATRLYEDQLKDWSLFADNREGLNQAKLKTFKFDGFDINVQYNPGRIISSAAKVDKKSIQERKCFLCKVNRPQVQKEILWGNSYEILVNPFPIFKKHFTISNVAHTDQQIETEFLNFISLSKDLPELVLFYNAPKCGASAPDHLHFQAGNLGFLTIEKDWEHIRSTFGKDISGYKDVQVTAVDDVLRRYIVLESNGKEAMNKVFLKIHKFAEELENGEAPMLNILSYYKDGKYRVFVFLRRLHRPWQFSAEGDKNILLSPASVDMGGTLITPKEKDFKKITKEDITDIFNQITISKDNFEKLIKILD